MLKHVLLFAGASLLMASSALAQQRKACGTMDILASEIAADPARAEQLARIETQTQEFLATHPDADRGTGTIIIPVIWHVVYNTPEQNIPTSQIMEAMDQLNAYFSFTNSNAGSTPAAFQALAANVNIQFCMAQRDPDGNPSNGIRRRSTYRTEFPFTMPFRWEKFAYAGGDNAWPRDQYLNIWTCNMTGLADGIGQFPGGPANTDGVTMLYTEIGSLASPGPSGSPHVLTHELGHWLNLQHIWGNADCGDDFVSDTPTAFGPNGECPTFPSITCSNGPNGDLFCDHMDYTSGECITMFTHGQSARMNALFAPGGARAALLSSNGCTPGVANCPTTQLNATPGPNFSCGATGKVVGASGNAGKLFGVPVTHVISGNNVAANKYQFELSIAGEGYLRTIASDNAVLVLGKWTANPLKCGTYTYDVRVHASFDGGVTYCPYGASCSVEITNNFAQPFCTPAGGGMVENQERSLEAAMPAFEMWPNPNDGTELYLALSELDQNATTVSIDLFDLYGKRVMTNTLPIANGAVNTTLSLNADLASGLYFVKATCGTTVRTERLMLQR